MAALSQLERIERGREAAALLKNQMLIDAFAGVEVGIVEQWKATPDVASRETLWAGLHGARRVELHLLALVDDGKIAAQEAEQANKL